MKQTTKTKIKAPEAKPKTAAHYTENYILNPAHPITINLIGCGGTGSQVLNSLARMNSALISLGHPGLFVRAIDPDKVTDANMGRQLFSPVDIGAYKSMVLIGRINRFFGLDWEGLPTFYKSNGDIRSANITISCVDSGKARKEIKTALQLAKVQPIAQQHAYRPTGMQPYEIPYYWMDFGNTQNRGQVIIGTIQSIKQPADCEHAGKATLPTVDKIHPDILHDIKGEDQGPSCSLAEALGKQDLFINTNLANMGLGLLWKMFREAHIKYHGLYLNLETMQTNPLPIN